MENKHKKLSLHYFDNALKYIDKGDAEKASEFLWGSFTQAIKAVASRKKIELRSHKILKEYVVELTKELGDDNIRRAFFEAQSLHSNFYESGLEIIEIGGVLEDIKPVLKKLLDMVPD
jgi:hypothetical protein